MIIKIIIIGRPLFAVAFILQALFDYTPRPYTLQSSETSPVVDCGIIIVIAVVSIIPESLRRRHWVIRISIVKYLNFPVMDFFGWVSIHQAQLGGAGGYINNLILDRI